MKSDINTSFFRQAPVFISRSLSSLGLSTLDDLPHLSDEFPTLLPPVIIRDFHNVTADEREKLSESFHGRNGVAYFIVMNPKEKAECGHPLIDLSKQLSDVLPLAFPIAHPAESEPVTLSTLGPPDGTLKVFQRHDQVNSQEDKELHMHQDGIGSGGSITAIALYCESGPLWGGLTCFQNALRLALELARRDMEAFEALFHPTAVTVLRRQGRNALKVVGPVLYLNGLGQPQVFLRSSGGEYEMFWSEGEALERARQFLEPLLKPFAPGTRFVQFSLPGQGCFINNRAVLHGRTKFIDDANHRRVLSRKWFADIAEDAEIKRVPGLKIWAEYASLRPDLFGEDSLRGMWLYNDTLGRNVKL
jgi:alpha-ketoglutarate-dependent taurine dioxygenase